jgi:hypothetical protein
LVRRLDVDGAHLGEALPAAVRHDRGANYGERAI